jgi:D-serine dehydratase
MLAARPIADSHKETGGTPMQLVELKRLPLDHRVKGFPGSDRPTSIGGVGKRRWNVLKEDMPLPVAVLRDSALKHNSRWMRKFLEVTGAYFCPHGKTTMSPQLFERQIDDGSWGITVATAQQLQVARDYGVQRIIMANQLVGPQAIRYVLDEVKRDKNFDFYCLVDSVAGVRMLSKAAKARKVGRPLQVLLEGGYLGGRTGVRDMAAAVAVAEAVAKARPYLELRGVEGFEGLAKGPTPEARAEKVAAFLKFLCDVAVELGRRNLFGPGEVLLSAGGSAFYDMVVAAFKTAKVDRGVRIVVRSGCYLTHDEAHYGKMFADVLKRSPEARALGKGLRPALEVWAYVQSRPEPTRALVTMGQRDAGRDAGYPTPIKWLRPGKHRKPQPIPAGFALTDMNDQHGYLDMPADSPLRVGDMVGFGVSHPCTTFDKWQVLYLVDDDYNVIEAVRTFF